jgi:hypothetical protein
MRGGGMKDAGRGGGMGDGGETDRDPGRPRRIRPVPGGETQGRLIGGGRAGGGRSGDREGKPAEREEGTVAPPYRLVGARPAPGFEITVDGKPVPVVPGQTIGAALYTSGIRAWRTTRFGRRPRGLFCGIGVCFDCLITINGHPSLRACVTEAREGDVVTTDGPPASGAEAAP